MLTIRNGIAAACGGIVSLTLAGCIAASAMPTPTPTDSAAVTEVVAPEPTPTITPTATPIPTPVPMPTELPLCPTEDSEGCYWDASEQGNGQGTDVVNPPAPEETAPPTSAPRPGDTERATGPVAEWDANVLFCGVNARPAIDTDPYGNAWAYCEPALAE